MNWHRPKVYRLYGGWVYNCPHCPSMEAYATWRAALREARFHVYQMYYEYVWAKGE